jgi:hypothetical protein
MAVRTALGRERHLGVVGQALQVGGQRGKGHHLDVAALQPEDQAGRVGRDVDDDFVQVGLARQEELVEAL